VVSKTIKARYRNGVIEPLEKMELKEGEEFTLTMVRLPEAGVRKDAFRDSRGGWKELIDCEELKRSIYEDRMISTRPGVKL